MDFSLLAWGDGGWSDEMLRGALMTMAVAVCAYVLGILIGSLFAALKLSSVLVLRVVADAYTTIVRGIPELLIIYLVAGVLYLGLTSISNRGFLRAEVWANRGVRRSEA